jgi:cell division protein ZapA (FtsZ GTPase activity inhibitor)
MVNELRLDILGTSFTIMADEDETYLQEILAKYRAAVENTQNISGITDALNVAILTGFMLCDEINKLRLNREGETKEAEERTLGLIAKLDQVLKKAPENV